MRLSGIMRRTLRKMRFHAVSACVLAPALALVGGSAHAGDWSIESRISEQVDFFDNYGLDLDPNGYVIASTTDFYSDFNYLGHDQEFNLIGDIVARGYVGPGSDDLSNNLSPRLEANYHKWGKRTDISLGSYIAREYIPALQQADIVDPSAPSTATTRYSFGVNSTVAYKVSARNTVKFSNSASWLQYTESGDDRRTLDSSLSFSRRLTKRTDGDLSVGVNWMTAQDEAETEQLIYRVRGGLSSKLSKRTNASFGAGVNLLNTEKTDLLAPGLPRTSSSKLGFLADAAINYQLKTLSIALSASYGLQPGVLGDLQNRAVLSLSVNKQINERSSLVFIATAQASENVDDTGDSGKVYGLSVGPTYTLALTDEWDFHAGYRYSLKDRQEGTATSNNVFISLSRDFVAQP